MWLPHRSVFGHRSNGGRPSAPAPVRARLLVERFKQMRQKPEEKAFFPEPQPKTPIHLCLFSLPQHTVARGMRHDLPPVAQKKPVLSTVSISIPHLAEVAAETIHEKSACGCRCQPSPTSGPVLRVGSRPSNKLEIDARKRMILVANSRKESNLARFEQKDRNLPDVKVNEVVGLVCHIGTEVPANDAMPCRVMLSVEFLLDMSRNILLNAVSFQCLVGTINCVLLHVIWHVGVADHEFPIPHFR